MELSQRTFTEVMRKVTRNVISIGIRSRVTGLGHLFEALNNCEFISF